MDESHTRVDSGSPAVHPDEVRTTFCGRACRATLFLGVGILAGTVACAAISRYGTAFGLPSEVELIRGQRMPTLEEERIIDAAERVQSYQNTVLSVAILGGVAGAALGLAVGLRSRTVTATAGGLIGGAILGAAFGAAGGFVELFAAYRLWEFDFARTFKTMMAHSAAFLISGVGIGLAAGLATRRVRHSLGVVLAAAFIAGLVYPGLAAAVFPISNTDAVVPGELGPLLMWTVMPVALMGLALGRMKVVRRTIVRT